MNIQFLKLIVTYLILIQCIQIVISDDSISICSGCEVVNNICKIGNSEGANQCNEYYCKPNGDSCIDCSSALKSSLSKYYSIENGVCIKKSGGSDCNKIIIENNQCVDACPEDLYEFGDFCYIKCYGNNAADEFKLGLETDTSNPTRKCKCKDDKYFIEETINNKKYFRCVDSCPSGYFDANTNKCVDKCEGSTNKITPENGCTDICLDDQFLFEQSEKINDETITKFYCVKNCPDEARFFYQDTSLNQERKCLKECNKYDFYSVEVDTSGYKKYKCSDRCNGISFIDLISNYFFCGSNTESCNESFPYKYRSSCLRDCSDTQKLQMFENTKTYFLIDESDTNYQKYCSEECQLQNSIKLFKNSNTLSCHSSCEETTNKFNFNNECVNSCDEQHPYHLYDKGTCVSKCEDGNEDEKEYHLLLEEKTCYTEVPNGIEYKILDIINNEWNTCKIPKNPGSPSYGEGFIYNNICYQSCNIAGEQYFHIVNDNHCIENCINNGGIYKYSIGDDSKQNYVCYSSCKDIPGDFKHEYGFKCYEGKQAGELDYSEYYYKESDIYKHIKSNDAGQINNYCSKLGLYYLKDDDKQCVKDCLTEEYKELFSKDESGNIISLGKCLGNNGCNDKYLFISENQKICYTEADCPYKKYTDTDSSENNKYCVIQCPSKYQYESEDGKNCVSTCDNFYIENEGKKICVPNCKDYSML